MSHEQSKALYHFLNGRDTFACLPTEHGKTLIYQIAVLVARTGKVKILPSNALVVVVSPLNALISDQLESCQRLKLKAVKMEQELFDNDDKLTELEEAKVVYLLQTSRDGSVAKPRSMLNKAIFDPWQRSLFSRQRTSGKEPLLAGKVSEETVIPRRCRSETLTLAIKQVNKGQISTVTETYNEVAVSSLTVKI